MVERVTCRDITGRSRAELTMLCKQVTVKTAEPMGEDQRQAARLLLEAFASFVVAGVTVPPDIRQAVRDLILHGEGLAGPGAPLENQAG